jgi:hypothetical protein
MFMLAPPVEAKKEPAVVSAERFMTAVIAGDDADISQSLDPQISFSCPMGIYHGRPNIKAWIQFELSILKPYASKIIVHSTTSEDGIRSAVTRWSVGGLWFTDAITQTQFLTLRSIKRTMERRNRTKEDAEIADALLLAWTGPYFSKYCARRKGPGIIDNRALVLPLLDYSHQKISNVREILTNKPKEGKLVQEESVIFHFLTSAAAKEQQEQEAKNSQAQQQLGDSKANEKLIFQNQPKEVTIKAKNRQGETLAIIIDTNSLQQADTRLENMDDKDFAVNKSRTYYVASGIKLNNNDLVEATKLDSVLKLFVVNAFYFLSVVDLSSNKLTSVPDLSQYPVSSLYLHDNNISSWAALQPITMLTQLSSLTLFGNPIQSSEASIKTYKFNVLCLCCKDTSSSASTQSSAGARGRSPSPECRPTSPVGSGGVKSKLVTLKQLDHSVVSPLELQTLEQFFPKIQKRLRRASSPPRRAPSPK